MSSQAFDPLKSSAPLIVYIDYKSPYAYLAVAPTCAMADELGITIDWRPFTLDIASYLGTARLNKEGKVVEENRAPGQWLRVRYAYRDVRRYGAMRGIIVRGTEKIWDSSLAGIGMLWAKAQGDAMFRAYTAIVYERFWKRELDIEDIGVIERVLNEAGARPPASASMPPAKGARFTTTSSTATFDAGIFGVPTYIINGEKFFGREHLPRVRWMLTGRAGAAPDITYPEARDARPRKKRRFRSPSISRVLKRIWRLGRPALWRMNSASRSIGCRWSLARRRRRRLEMIVDRGIAVFGRITSSAMYSRYAAARGLEIRGFDRHRDSSLAAIGLLCAKRQDSKNARVLP